MVEKWKQKVQRHQAKKKRRDEEIDVYEKEEEKDVETKDIIISKQFMEFISKREKIIVLFTGGRTSNTQAPLNKPESYFNYWNSDGNLVYVFGCQRDQVDCLEFNSLYRPGPYASGSSCIGM